MKTVTYNDISVALGKNRAFKECKDWLITDPVYLLPSLDTVRGYMRDIKEGWLENSPPLRPIPSLCKCEEFALFFLAEVRKQRCLSVDFLPVKDRKNLAIGEALGTKWRGKEKPHHANICLTGDGFYLLDAWSQEIWKATPSDDNIFFVRF